MTIYDDTESERPSDDELPDIPTFEAALDDDQMYLIEECCQEHAMGVHRRGLLAALTMDSEKLFDACESEPEAFFELFEKSAQSVSQYRRLLELLNAAHTRLMIGLCCVDMDAEGAPFSMEQLNAAVTLAQGEED